MFDNIVALAELAGGTASDVVCGVRKPGCEAVGEVNDVVADNLGKSAAIVAAGVGVAGDILSGVAAGSAGLAALGGVCLVGGGLGMAGCTAFVTGMSSATGVAA
jgi:hypothetical protein